MSTHRCSASLFLSTYPDAATDDGSAGAGDHDGAYYYVEYDGAE